MKQGGTMVVLAILVRIITKITLKSFYCCFPSSHLGIYFLVYLCTTDS